MKQLVLGLLLVVGMTAVAGQVSEDAFPQVETQTEWADSHENDLVLSGYLMHNEKVTIQVYQGNELILEKSPVFDYYKLKLEPGEYTVYFTDENRTKKLYVSITRAYHVIIDVDFSTKNDCCLEDSVEGVNYKILSKKVLKEQVEE